MDNMPINVVLLGSFPEATLVLLLGLALIGIKPNWKRVIIVGFLQGIIAYFIRKNLGFGVHTVVLYLSMVTLTWIIVKTNLLVSAVANGLGFIINSLIEGIVLSIIMNFTSITFAEILSRSWLRLAITTPKQIALLMLFYLCIKYKYTLEDDIGIFKKLKQNA